MSDEGICLDGGKPRLDDLKQARAQACWLKERLEVLTGNPRYVTAVVLYPGWTVVEDEAVKYRDSWVLGPREFVQRIKGERTRLTADEVGELRRVVRTRLLVG